MAGCEPERAPLRVAVLLSGGVDSSLALRLLLAAGHRVTAFYLQIWFQEDFRNFWDACPWEEDLEFARKVCDSLGVPLEVVPLTTAYWDRVVAASVAEIRAGRTPNPDMWCNSRVKFGAFYDYLDTKYGNAAAGGTAAAAGGTAGGVTAGLVFDRVASGHYARVERVRGGAGPSAATTSSPASSDRGAAAHAAAAAGVAADAVDAERRGSGARASSSGAGGAARVLHAGAERRGEGGPEEGQGQGDPGEQVLLRLTPDAVKDQTYFLASLSPQQLRRVMFPLGALTKSQVRQLAAAANLANKDRKDSQGICFLGKVKFPEFVKEHLGEWPGPILEAESGRPVGVHAGYWFYTVGQRGGIKLPGGPWYVVAKDPQLNAVLVSRQYYDGQLAQQRGAFTCGPFNWLSGRRPVLRQGGEGGGVGGLAPGQGGAADGRHSGNGSCSSSSGGGGGGGVLAASGSGLADGGGSGGGSAGGGGAAADEPLLVKVRHGPNVYRCRLQLYGGPAGDEYGSVVLEQGDQGLAAGQYAVFYQGGVCLGAAMITACGGEELGEQGVHG